MNAALNKQFALSKYLLTHKHQAMSHTIPKYLDQRTTQLIEIQLVLYHPIASRTLASRPIHHPVMRQHAKQWLMTQGLSRRRRALTDVHVQKCLQVQNMHIHDKYKYTVRHIYLLHTSVKEVLFYHALPSHLPCMSTYSEISLSAQSIHTHAHTKLSQNQFISHRVTDNRSTCSMPPYAHSVLPQSMQT